MRRLGRENEEKKVGTLKDLLGGKKEPSFGGVAA